MKLSELDNEIQRNVNDIVNVMKKIIGNEDFKFEIFHMDSESPGGHIITIFIDDELFDKYEKEFNTMETKEHVVAETENYVIIISPYKFGPYSIEEKIEI